MTAEIRCRPVFNQENPPTASSCDTYSCQILASGRLVTSGKGAGKCTRGSGDEEDEEDAQEKKQRQKPMQTKKGKPKPHSIPDAQTSNTTTPNTIQVEQPPP